MELHPISGQLMYITLQRQQQDRTGLAVLRHTKTASTLTEFGFISNKSEAASMKTNTDKYGKAMYDSVVKMFKTNPSKR